MTYSKETGKDVRCSENVTSAVFQLFTIVVPNPYCVTNWPSNICGKSSFFSQFYQLEVSECDSQLLLLQKPRCVAKAHNCPHSLGRAHSEQSKNIMTPSISQTPGKTRGL